MGMMWIFAPIGVLIILRSLLLDRYFPKIILGGVAVGAVVGVIIVLVRDNWWIVLLSSVVGLHAGLVVELIYGLIERNRFLRRFRK
jgi:hypothetical protein